ncbi:MAG: peptidoglycan editing factor PgeF [Roseburia sp.]
MPYKIANNEKEMCPRVLKHDAQPAVELLYYPMLEKTGMVKHCFTTREGGVSQGIFSTMNLSFTRGDDPEAVRQNYLRVAQALGVDFDRIVCSDQTHTTNVRYVTQEDAGCGLTRPRSYQDVDGLITDVPGITLATFYADCVPLYFVDPVHRAIGLSHSGWRGTVSRMGEVTLKAMGRTFGTVASDVICAIGPSICGNCYEVSGDVAEEFKNAFGTGTSQMLVDKGNGKFQLDLWEANRQVLTGAGVLPEHLVCTNLCTCCNADLLFSHRASKGKRGNLGAFLCIK